MGPKFTVRISRAGIKYFYLSNLALQGRKFWVRKTYNKKFISAAGPLTPAEKKGVKLLRQVIVSLEKRRVNLLDIFFGRNRLKSVGYSGYRHLKSALNVLNRKFKVFRHKELSGAFAVKKHLEENIRKRKRLIDKTLRKLSVLFGKINLPRIITVFLIPLPDDIYERGGKYIPSSSSVIIEVSRRKVSERRTVEIILHEMVHLSFESETYFNDIAALENTLPNGVKRRLIKPFGVPSVRFGLKEIIATATTMGTLETRKLSDNYSKLLNHCSIRLKPLIASYLKSKKKIDFNFLEKALSFWSAFLKEEQL